MVPWALELRWLPLLFVLASATAVPITTSTNVSTFESLNHALQSFSQACHASDSVNAVITIKESISVPDSYITENGSTFTSVDISLNSTLSIVGSQGENNGKPTIDLQNTGRFLSVIPLINGMEPMQLKLKNLIIINGGFPLSLYNHTAALVASSTYPQNLTGLLPSNDPYAGKAVAAGGVIYVRGVQISLVNVEIRKASALVGGVLYQGSGPYRHSPIEDHLVQNTALTIINTTFEDIVGYLSASVIYSTASSLFYQCTAKNTVQDSHFSRCYTGYSGLPLDLLPAFDSDMRGYIGNINSALIQPSIATPLDRIGAFAILILTYIGQFDMRVDNSKFTDCVVLPVDSTGLSTKPVNAVGGGLMVNLGYGHNWNISFDIRRSHFENCSAASKGDALSVTLNEDFDVKRASIEDSSFIGGNYPTVSEQRTEQRGSMVYLASVSPEFRNCLFSLGDLGNQSDRNRSTISLSPGTATFHDVQFEKPAFKSSAGQTWDIEQRSNSTIYACPTEMFLNGSVSFWGDAPSPKICPAKECVGVSLKSEYIKDAMIWVVMICIYSMSFFYLGQVASWATLRNAEQFRRGQDKTTGNAEKSQTASFDSEQFAISSSGYTQDSSEDGDEILSVESLWERVLEKLRHRLAALHLIKQSDIIHIRNLASGGFKDVTLALWDGKPVAVALLQQSALLCSSHSVSDFAKEILLLSKCSHPSLVQTYAILEDRPGIVMEYITGGSLRSFRQRLGNDFSVPLFVSLAVEISSGLAFLHSRRIIHFDIKSDNILVEMRGGTMHAKIIDLGLAGIKRIENSAVTADRLRGTIPYCAPEVLNAGIKVQGSRDNKNTFSDKVDVYSFGMVLYELWCSHPPFEGLNYAAIISSVLGDTDARPDANSSLFHNCPWVHIMRECWKRDPAERPRMEAVHSQLRNIDAYTHS